MSVIKSVREFIKRAREAGRDMLGLCDDPETYQMTPTQHAVLRQLQSLFRDIANPGRSGSGKLELVSELMPKQARLQILEEAMVDLESIVDKLREEVEGEEDARGVE